MEVEFGRDGIIAFVIDYAIYPTRPLSRLAQEGFVLKNGGNVVTTRRNIDEFILKHPGAMQAANG